MACRQGTLTPPDTSLLGLAFVLLVKTSDILYRLDIIPVCDIIIGLYIIILNPTFHQILVSIEHLQRLWHANRGRLLLRTPGPVPLGLAYVLLVETNPFSELVVIFPDYALRISLGTFSILIFIIHNNKILSIESKYFKIFLTYIFAYNQIDPKFGMILSVLLLNVIHFSRKITTPQPSVFLQNSKKDWYI